MIGRIYQAQVTAIDNRQDELDEAPGGTLHIWDANIASASPEPFLAELAVNANGEAIRVTYGIVREHARQDAAHFIALCASAGLCLSGREDAEEGFYPRFTKQEEDKELSR